MGKSKVVISEEVTTHADDPSQPGDSAKPDEKSAEPAPKSDSAEGAKKKGDKKGKKGKKGGDDDDENLKSVSFDAGAPAEDKKGSKKKGKKGKGGDEGGDDGGGGEGGAEGGAEGGGEGGGEGGDEAGDQAEKKGKGGKKDKGKKKGKKDALEVILEEGQEAGTVEEGEGEDKKGKKGKSKSAIDLEGKTSKSGADLKKKRKSSTFGSKMGVKSSVYGAWSDSLYSISSSSDEERGAAEEEKPKGKKAAKDKGKGKKGKKGDEEGGEEKPKKEKEAKGKKGKKGKEKKEEKAEDEEDDVMAAILAMKQDAGGEVQEPEEVEDPKQKKQSKKEKARLQKEKEEQARIQAEQEAAAAEEAAKKRDEYLNITCKAKEKKDIMEQAQRVDQLTASAAWIRSMNYFNWNLSCREKADYEWTEYLKCDGLPSPGDPAQMNTYLHLWEKVPIDDVTPEECVRRTREVLGLLEVLNNLIDDPFDVRESIIQDWYWVRELTRNFQQINLDTATYRLIRDIEGRMNRIDIPTADFQILDDNFKLCLWLFVRMAPPMINPRAPQKPRLTIKFPEMNMQVVFPVVIDGKDIVVRGVYVKYDHLTDTCASYNPPPMPAEFDLDLLEVITKEWYIRMMYRWNNRTRKHIMVENIYGEMVEGPLEPEPEIEEGELPPPSPFVVLDPTPSEHAIAIEDEMYTQNRISMCDKVPTNDNVINLRKFLIVGGIFYMNLYYQPTYPQDKVFFEVRLTNLIMPKSLDEMEFKVDYHYIEPEPEPEDDPEGDPENPLPEKTQDEIDEDERVLEELRAAELDKLLMFTVKLPEHVIFLDLPTVCTWDPDNKYWTTNDIIDVRQIEEDNSVVFKTTRFGAFSFAINRYLNFPFQAWELKPDVEGTVLLQITCAILMVEFHVKKNTVCLWQLHNSPNKALQDQIGIYYKLPKLIRILREGGIDLFPSYDAFCYIESGHCEKHWPLEKSLYQLMGLMSSTFNFQWSRWNVQAPRRSIIMQMREYHLDRPKQVEFHMLLTTPLKAVFVDCTEISQEFTEEPIQAYNKFCSDLFHLMKASATMSTKNKVAKAHFDVSKTVGDLLIATRIHSFS